MFSLQPHINLLCTKHLRENVSDYVKSATGVTEGNKIIDGIYSQDGLLTAPCHTVYEERLKILTEEVESLVSTECGAKIKASMRNTFFPALLKGVMEPYWEGRYDDVSWTNNNTESLNHILKQITQWKPRQIPTLIDNIKARYMDIGYTNCNYWSRQIQAI